MKHDGISNKWRQREKLKYTRSKMTFFPLAPLLTLIGRHFVNNKFHSSLLRFRMSKMMCKGSEAGEKFMKAFSKRTRPSKKKASNRGKMSAKQELQTQRGEGNLLNPNTKTVFLRITLMCGLREIFNVNYGVIRLIYFFRVRSAQRQRKMFFLSRENSASARVRFHSEC